MLLVCLADGVCEVLAWKNEGRRGTRESFRDGRPQGRRQPAPAAANQPPTPQTPQTPESLEAMTPVPAWQEDATPPASAPATPVEKRRFDGPYRPPMTGGMPRRRFHDWNTPLERDMRLEKELFPESEQPTDAIDFSKYENIPAELTGNNPTQPIVDFRTMEFPFILQDNVKLAGYVVPTPVQKYAIPAVMGGRDLMACAQTGMR